MAFGWDKLRAEAGQWRVAESTLLNLAFFGGSAGAYLGRKLFRHKTRKQHFSDNLHRITYMQIFASVFGLTFFGIFLYPY